MAANYFTDEQVNAIHKEICRLEDLDSGISMPLQPLNHIEIANLRRIMNLAVDTAKGRPYGYTDGLGSVFIDGNSDCDIPLYLIQELDN